MRSIFSVGTSEVEDVHLPTTGSVSLLIDSNVLIAISCQRAKPELGRHTTVGSLMISTSILGGHMIIVVIIDASDTIACMPYKEAYTGVTEMAMQGSLLALYHSYIMILSARFPLVLFLLFVTIRHGRWACCHCRRPSCILRAPPRSEEEVVQ